MPTHKIRRNTPQRQVILDELCASKEHPTAAELFAMVRKRLPRVSLGTVYRNLEVLHQDGLILKLETSGNEARFDGTTTPHYHVRCTACGCVRDLHTHGPETLVSQPLHADGFRIEGHHLEYYGTCPDCLRAGAKHSAGISQAERSSH